MEHLTTIWTKYKTPRGPAEQSSKIKNNLGHPMLDPVERDVPNKKLGEASRLLDQSVNFTKERP